MVKQTALVLLGLCAIAALITSASDQLLGRTARPLFEVHGHRGASGDLPPGNTLVSFEAAIAKGAHVLEADLRLTDDKRIVLAHDPTVHTHCIHPNPQAERTLTKLTLAQVREFDCHPEIPGRQPPPTLDELLALVEGTERGLNLEFKPRGTAIVKRTAEVLLDYNDNCEGCFMGRITVESFRADQLKPFVDLVRGRAIKPRTSFLSRGTPLGELRQMKSYVDIYSPQAAQAGLDRNGVALIKKEGFLVIPWTVNELTEICEVARWGTDGIISDFPQRARLVADYITREGTPPSACDSFAKSTAARPLAP